MLKYKPLKINFTIPEELQLAIDGYLHSLNYDNGGCEDCHRTEIMCELNWCYREGILTNEQIKLLRDYYQHKGILRNECNG